MMPRCDGSGQPASVGGALSGKMYCLRCNRIVGVLHVDGGSDRYVVVDHEVSSHGDSAILHGRGGAG
jgi:hypothetical protein